MSTPTNQLQQSPFLRAQRQFPNDDLQALSNQMDHTYIDIAQKVNYRTIGIYPTNFLAITGDRWYLTGSNSALQSLRQIYTFTAIGPIPHGLDWDSVSQISPKSYGTYTDDTNWYGCLYASITPIVGQVSFYVTDINIVVVSGAGAPAITNGTIVLEYISNL